MCDTATALRTCLVRVQRWWGDGVLRVAGAHVWLAAAEVAVVRGAAGPRVLLGSTVSGLLPPRAAAAAVALGARRAGDARHHVVARRLVSRRLPPQGTSPH